MSQINLPGIDFKSRTYGHWSLVQPNHIDIYACASHHNNPLKCYRVNLSLMSICYAWTLWSKIEPERYLIDQMTFISLSISTVISVAGYCIWRLIPSRFFGLNMDIEISKTVLWLRTFFRTKFKYVLTHPRKVLSQVAIWMFLHPSPLIINNISGSVIGHSIWVWIRGASFGCGLGTPRLCNLSCKRALTTGTLLRATEPC